MKIMRSIQQMARYKHHPNTNLPTRKINNKINLSNIKINNAKITIQLAIHNEIKRWLHNKTFMFKH